MTHPLSSQSLVDSWLDAAISISLAVEAGADPADPAVIAALDDLVATFAPRVLVGDDAPNILRSGGSALAYLNGLGGADLLVGSASSDVAVGGDGADALFGDGNRDALFGSAGDDLLAGGFGDDVLFGGSENDLLEGGFGDDLLDGGAGSDVLDGGVGRDTLDGGTGVDTLTGGEGRDRFLFTGPAFENPATVAGDGLRQIENTPDILRDFTDGEDRFVFDTSDFNVSGNKKVSNALAADLRDGANVIVLRDTDNDGNAATAFNAGAAATLIADNLDTDGAGFFVYWNSALGINRLVHSANLNDATADIRVLGNIEGPTGLDAIAALEDFGARDFAFL